MSDPNRYPDVRPTNAVAAAAEAAHQHTNTLRDYVVRAGEMGARVRPAAVLLYVADARRQLLEVEKGLMLAIEREASR